LEKRGSGRPQAVKASQGLREQLFRGRWSVRQRPVRWRRGPSDGGRTTGPRATTFTVRQSL